LGFLINRCFNLFGAEPANFEQNFQRTNVHNYFCSNLPCPKMYIQSVADGENLSYFGRTFLSISYIDHKKLRKILKGYGATDARKTWSSRGSTYCTCLAWCINLHCAGPSLSRYRSQATRRRVYYVK